CVWDFFYRLSEKAEPRLSAPVSSRRLGPNKLSMSPFFPRAALAPHLGPLCPGGQHPAMHFPAASNTIVLPESGMCTGTLTAFMKASVLLPGRTLPPTVPTSFACEAITDAGFTRSLIT